MSEEKITESGVPEKKKNWFVQHKVLTVVIVLVIIGAAGSGGKISTSEKTTDVTNKTTTNKVVTETPKEDLSKVATEYTLSAGYYTAGIDLPAGKCNIVAVSGTGNLSSSNMYSGGINEMFGIDDSDLYTDSFNGLKFPAKTELSVGGDLVIKLTFTAVESNFSGRTYDESAAQTLTDGNYTAGTDFPAGIYKIVAVSGRGNLSSSNIYDGGINEMFGVDDGSGFYVGQFLNVDLGKAVTLEISGGLTIQLTPAK